MGGAGSLAVATTGALGIRRGEGMTTWLFFVYFFLVACSQYAVKSVRQATFLDSLGADQLPWVYLGVAVISLPILVVYSRLAEGARPHRMIVGFSLGHALMLIAFYWLLATPAAGVSIVFFLWVTIAFGIAVSQLWSYAHFALDSRQARRLFAIIGAGGLLGGIPGGLLAIEISRRAGTRATLLAAAAVMVAAVGVVVLIEHRRPKVLASQRPVAEWARLEAPPTGLRAVLSSRLLVLIAWLVVVTMVAAQMVDLQFNLVVESATRGLDQRTAVFGAFFSLMGVVAFVFQLLFTRQIHRRMGVGVGVRVLPVTVAMVSVAMVLAVGLFPVALLAVAWLLKLAEGSLRHSVDQSSRELLFQPIPVIERRRAKTFIDVFVQRFAKGVAALLLLPVTFGVLGLYHVGLMTLVVVAVWLWLAAAARRAYVQAFRDGLLAGPTESVPAIDTDDLTTVTTLVECLGSSDDRRVLHAVELLANHGEGRLVSPLLIHHRDPEVRRATIGVLAAGGRTDAAPLVEHAIGDDDPDVRSAAILALAVLRGESPVDVIRARLDDPDPRTRAAAVAFLLDVHDQARPEDASRVLAEMLSDGEPTIRAEAAKALGQLTSGRGRSALVQLLYDPDRGVVRAAISAVRRRLAHGDSSPIFVPILISKMGDRHLKHDAREAIAAYGAVAIEPLALFMGSPDEQIAVRRAVPHSIALIGGELAVTALTAALSAGDEFLRGNVVEALVALRHRHGEPGIARQLVHSQIRLEAGRYLQYLADLTALHRSRPLRLVGPWIERRAEPTAGPLIERFLADRIDHSIHTLFRLLELWLPPADARAAFRSLASSHVAVRAQALEYLDNTLATGLRRDVFAVIDDEPVSDKLRRASGYGVRVEGREQVLARLLAADLTESPDRIGLVVAALHELASGGGVAALAQPVAALAQSSAAEVVRETAEWTSGRMRSPDDGHRAGVAGGVAAGAAGEKELTVVGLTRIEMVLVLQSVDLFAHCTAEQVLRLAAIAREMRFSAGDVIYRRNGAADTLFCVIDGRVALDDGAGGRREIGAHGRFGVLEILSGRLRTTDAVAVDDARVLAIEAEDLFDLLSANIEIVKALFRRLAGAEDVAGLA